MKHVDPGGSEEDFRLLSSMTARLASTANLDEIAEMVLDEIVRLGFGAAWVAVLDEATGNLRTLREVVDGREGTVGMPEIFMADLRQPIGHAFRERRMISVKDPASLVVIEDYEEFPPDKVGLPRYVHERLRERPFACGPLLGSRGQPVGALGLSSYLGQRPIPEELLETGLLRAFMDHLGIAMERALFVRRLEQLNSELVRAQELLTHNARKQAVGELATAVAHDLNNLCCVVLGATSMGARSPEAALDAVPRVERAARAIADLVARLQRVSRTEEMGALASVDLSQIVEDVLFMLDPILREESIRVETDLVAAAHVLGDASMLHQVIVNLVLNAREALGEVPPKRRRLRVTMSEGEGEAHLAISDSGPGFPAEILERAFEPFVTGKGKDHTGLGLATAHSVVKHFGGSLHARNLPSGGCEIRASFATAARQRPATAPPRPAAGKSLSVLAIDDDRDVVEILADYLDALGHRTSGVTEPRKALRAAREGHFDVIVCDVGMPGMNGLDLCARLREEGVGGKFVLMTGWDPEAVRADPRQASCDSILRKPFVADDISRIFGELFPEGP